MDLGITGRTALVLAGTSGLGLGTVRVLASEGARVVLCGRDADRAAAAAAKVRNATGGDVTGMKSDVSDAVEVASVVTDGAELLGGSIS